MKIYSVAQHKILENLLAEAKAIHHLYYRIWADWSSPSDKERAINTFNLNARKYNLKPITKLTAKQLDRRASYYLNKMKSIQILVSDNESTLRLIVKYVYSCKFKCLNLNNAFGGCVLNTLLHDLDCNLFKSRSMLLNRLKKF